jgi:hypothetical protein
MLDTFASKQGIQRLKVGSGILSVFEAASQAQSKQIATVLQALQAQDLDGIDGLALDAYGNSNGVPRLLARNSTGSVTITDSSFQKVSTKVSFATPAPIAGSTTINVNRTLDWLSAPLTGSLYIGRGTSNYEGPLAYTGITDNGIFLSITLTANTTHFHNQGESIVLAQGGDRPINAGEQVQTSQGSLATSVAFSVIYQYTLADGENSLEGVEVVCTEPGAIGNVPNGAINQFSSAPFVGANVSNPLPYINGRDTEIASDYRIRIKLAKGNPQRGVDASIEQAAIGLQDSLSETVSASALVRQKGSQGVPGYSILYVDDGTGYEETSEGIGLEILVNSAVGGETRFQTHRHQVAKAFAVSANTAPYVLEESAQLSVTVGGVSYVHTFDSNEFTQIANATAFEVVASVNSDSEFPVSARTSGGGTLVVLEARGETNEDLRVQAAATGFDSNQAFGFPVTGKHTMSLYLNDILLSKDGILAQVESREFGQWDNFNDPQTLTVGVDGTPTVVYTFGDVDFINNATSYNTIGKNSLESWAVVFNARLPGITATVNNNRITLTSNKGRSGLATVSVLGGTLYDVRMFDTQSVNGQDNDYSIDRATGDILLSKPLLPGDRLTLGSPWTRPWLGTVQLGLTTVASEINVWTAVDSDALAIPSGVTLATNLALFVNGVTDNTYRLGLEVIGGSSPVFSELQAGDWMVIGDTGFSIGLQGSWRVSGVQAGGTMIDFEKSEAAVPRYCAASVRLPISGNGDLMVIGGKTGIFSGYASPGSFIAGTGVTGVCERFNRTTHVWSFTAPLTTPRCNHTATLLENGRVLVVGGLDANGVSLATSEIYSPLTNTWAAGPSLVTPRSHHTATLLEDGRVLVVGGYYDAASSVGGRCVGTSEEFDPATDEFNNQSTLIVSRWNHAALRLSCAGGDTSKDGYVFVGGGYHQANYSGGVIANCEIYNPTSHLWVGYASMPSLRECFSLAQADNASPHRVLAVGSSWEAHAQSATYCIYNVDSNTWGTDTNLSQTANPIYFENSHLGTLFDGSSNWALVAPYALQVDGSNVCLKYTGYSDNHWTVQSSSLYQSVKQDVTAIEFGLTAGDNDRILFLGGYRPSASGFGYPVSTYETFATGTNAWEQPLDVTTPGGIFNLLSAFGLTFVRSGKPLTHVVIPSATYSSQDFVNALNDQILGVVASVYRTSALRLATANYSGSLLIALNTAPTLLPLTVGELVQAETGGSGLPATVKSGASNYGTPLDFIAYSVNYVGPSVNNSSVASIYLEALALPWATSTVIGLETPSVGTVSRVSNWAGYLADVASSASTGQMGTLQDIELGLRDTPPTESASGQSVYIAAPLQISPQDDLNVLIDGESETGLFNIPLSRQVQAVPSSSYSSTITVQEITGATLPSTFGLTYSYEDFAVFMHARVKTHASDTHKSILWRYWRLGSDGERFCVRYALPLTANATLNVSVTHDQNTPDLYGTPRSTISIILGSGGAKAGSTIRATTRLGVACTQNGMVLGAACKAYLVCGFKVLSYHRDTVGGPTCLTLSIPPGVSAFGCNMGVGDVVWFDAATPNHTTLWPGSFAIYQVDTYDAIAHTQNIWVPGGILDDGTATLTLTSNPGTISTDTTSAVKFDPTISVGDLVTLSSTFPNIQYTGEAMRVVTVGDSNQWLILDFANVQLASVSGSFQYSLLGSPSVFSVFGGSSARAADVVAAVNALAGVSNSSVPITGTVLGDGSGVISQASWAEDDLLTAHYQLTDGLNFVQKTTNPLVVTGNTQLLLKNPINTDLLSNSDWGNEEIRLVPQLISSIVEWLNTPTITGLWSKAEVVETANGQIQVTSLNLGSVSSVEILGGLGNDALAPVFGSLHQNIGLGVTSALVTVRRSDAVSLVGGRYLRIDNGVKLPKTGILAFQEGYSLTSVTASTKTWVTSSPLYNQNPYLMADAQVSIQSAGQYTLISFDTGTFQYSIIDSSGYVIVDQPDVTVSGISNVSQANCGTFRIVACNQVGGRIQVWVENSISVSESSQANVHFIEFDSLVVGDTLTFETTSFGQNNRGTFTVTEVGNSGVWYFKTDLTPQNLTSPVVFSSEMLPLVLEGPSRNVTKRLVAVCPNQTDGSYADLILEDTTGIKAVGQALGSVVRALDKLEFPLGSNSGSDAYRYNTGLLGVVSETIYRDPQDDTGNTGYVANGATVLVSGPKVRRVTVSLAVRAVNNSQSTIDQVQASVATFINSSQMGQTLAISDIIEAAKIPGVTAVSVIYPQYSSSNDVITLAVYEKAMVLDVSKDVSVVFVGE